MKRRRIILTILLLVCVLPVNALAVDETPTPSPTATVQPTVTPPEATQPIVDEEPLRPVRMVLDDENRYAGMDRSYSEGYTPNVQNGVAHIVLPLKLTGDMLQRSITATPELGATEQSPFLYRNYQKTVDYERHDVQFGSTLAYLVRFDLELNPQRINGVYPVSIAVSAQGMDGSLVTQTFVVYVTITDGKEKEANETPPEESPVPQPKLIVSGYRVAPSSVNAGEAFEATVTIKNTSETEALENILVRVSADCPGFALTNESNAIYIKRIGAGATKDIALAFDTDMDTAPGRYNVNLAMEYDHQDAMTLTASGSIAVKVQQALRVEMEMQDVAEQVYAGDTFPLNVNVMNLGRSAIYNVRYSLAGDGLIASTAFIGNLEAGSAATGKMNVFVGTKTMSEGYQGEERYGDTSGVVTLLYEDENGVEYTQTKDFNTRINEPVITTVSQDGEAEQERQQSQWWIAILISGLLALALFLWAVRRKRRGHADEEE